jgi:hypothetical protein
LTVILSALVLSALVLAANGRQKFNCKLVGRPVINSGNEIDLRYILPGDSNFEDTEAE